MLCNGDVYYALTRSRSILVLAGCKVNVLYAPGLAARLPPPTTAVWALKQPLCSHWHKITNEPVDYMALGPYDFAVGQQVH